MSPRMLWVLQRLREAPARIDEFGGTLREALIDAGMAEPPLVETDGPRVFLTAAGRAALKEAII